MEDKKYAGDYVVKIFLADTAWSNPQFNKEIKDGKIEKIIVESKGAKPFLKEIFGCQNIAIMDNSENALVLIGKLNSLPYISKIILIKDGLISKEEYISTSG